MCRILEKKTLRDRDYEKNGIVLAKKEVGAMYVRQSGRMTEAIMLEVVQQQLEKICVRTVEGG